MLRRRARRAAPGGDGHVSRSRSFAVGFAVMALAACGSVSNANAPATTVQPLSTSTTCSLPPLPASGAGDSADQLGGPAVAALRGGPAQAGFALDDGKFSLTPPSAADRPLMSMNQAECAAFAAMTLEGWSLGGVAASGIAVGYGQVSIAPSLTNSVSNTTYVARS